MDKNWGEAEQHLLAALHADPGSAEAHNTLGMIYLQRAELDPARRQFEETVKLQPGMGSAHYNLALIYQKQGKTDAAEREFRAAKDASGPNSIHRP
jgi:Tfp pilus assembly protein PilF